MSSNTRTTPEKVGRIAAKVASEAAYVITGMAGEPSRVRARARGGRRPAAPGRGPHAPSA